jgi:hypothetical protein
MFGLNAPLLPAVSVIVLLVDVQFAEVQLTVRFAGLVLSG